MLIRRVLPIVSVAVCLSTPSCDPGQSLATAGAEGGTGSTAVRVPTNAPTLEAPELETRNELVDDLEDGDFTFRLPDGEGCWHSETVELSAEAGGADDTELALRATSSGSASSFAAVLTREDAPSSGAHDYSSCDGIELWAKLGADAEAEEEVLVLAVESADGITGAELSVTRRWQRFSLDWADFGPLTVATTDPGAAGAAGAGPLSGLAAGATAATEPVDAAGVSLDATRVINLRFSQASLRDVWVDEVRLTNCELPLLNPPLPEPPALGSMGPEGSPVARWGQLRVDGTTLLDQSGNPVQLKGVSTQWLNWDNSPYPESKEVLAWLRDDWQLSVYRIAMGVSKWETDSIIRVGYLVSPERTRERVENIIQNALDLGVYVIIDWHSHNADTFVAEARAFFSDMAALYGEYPNVIYETFNEPLGDVSWSEVLKPYHESVVSTIRHEDPDNLILLGSPLWTQRVDEAAADPVRAVNVAYALHFYACEHREWNRERGDIALGLGAPLFVSEFGLTNADGGETGDVCEDEGNLWFDWMDERMISGVAWKLEAGCRALSCLIRQRAPLDGGWTQEDLHGHAPLVREWMRQ
jgi:endoglucanase